MTTFLLPLLMLFISTGVWAWAAITVAVRARVPGVPLALHPLFLVTIFIGFVAVDFLVLYADVASGETIDFSRRGITQPTAVANAMSVYAIMLSVAAAGLFAGAAGRNHRATAHVCAPLVSNKAALFTFLIILSATLVIFLPILLSQVASRGLFAVAGVRTVVGSQSPLLALVLLMLSPATLLYAAGARSRTAALMAIAAAGLVFLLFGSRFNLVILLYGTVFLLPVRRHVSVPALLLALPVVLLLLSYFGYVARLTYAYDSYGAYLAASGGFFSSIFRSVEFSIAEAMTVHLSETLIDRAWYESLLAGALALVPRELISWKPFGISTELTMAADPARWLLVRSEWTVGGFTNLIYEMGLPGASLAAFILFGALGVAINLTNHYYFTKTVLWLPFLLLLMLSFLRADVYNISLKLWGFGMLLGLHIAIAAILSANKSRRPAPVATRV